MNLTTKAMFIASAFSLTACTSGNESADRTAASIAAGASIQAERREKAAAKRRAKKLAEEKRRRDRARVTARLKKDRAKGDFTKIQTGCLVTAVPDATNGLNSSVLKKRVEKTISGIGKSRTDPSGDSSGC